MSDIAWLRSSRPALARIVVERAGDLAVALVFALAFDVGRCGRDSDFAVLRSAAPLNEELEICEDELTGRTERVFSVRVRRVRKHFEPQAGDPIQSARRGRHDEIVLRKFRRLRSNDPICVGGEDVAFRCGQPNRFDDRPRLKSRTSFLNLFFEPRGKVCLGTRADSGDNRVRFFESRFGFLNGPFRIRRAVLHKRSRSAACRAGLVDAVEVGRQAVVVALRNRVELVVVTLRAAERQTEPQRAYCVCSVEDVVDARFFFVPTALTVCHVVAMKARGEPLLGSRVRKQVSGKLLDRKLVERHVGVERGDDPVPPRPVGSRRV